VIAKEVGMCWRHCLWAVVCQCHAFCVGCLCIMLWQFGWRGIIYLWSRMLMCCCIIQWCIRVESLHALIES